MTDAEKAAAFDRLADALTNRFHDGRWSWFCPTPCGGKSVATKAEAVADLITWAERTGPRVVRKNANRSVRVPLEVVT
jgi:hypothetical protein